MFKRCMDIYEGSWTEKKNNLRKNKKSYKVNKRYKACESQCCCSLKELKY